MNRMFGKSIIWLLLLGAGLAAQNLDSQERAVVATIDHQALQAITFLEKVTNINSGTMNVKGNRKIGKLFQKELDALGFETQWIAMPPEMGRAGHLFAYRKGDRGKRLLLIGHLDTVFPKNAAFKRFTVEDTIAWGQGVADMKGGNVVILYALKALHEHGLLQNTTITVVLHGDEELPGQPLGISRQDIRAAAQESDIALGFEGFVAGTATVARRGSSQWALMVSGIEAHSSAIFRDEVGAGAIFEAARILNAFYAEVRGETYLTFNPGTILGGTEVTYDEGSSSGTAFGKTNVVARTVDVHGGLRFISEDQKEQARAKMRTITARNLPGTTAEISFTDSYPAMPPKEGNYRVFEAYNQASQDLGLGTLEPLDPGRRGAADISFVADYVDCLAGLGVEGRGSHTPSERVFLPSIARSAKRVAILIYRLTR